MNMKAGSYLVLDLQASVPLRALEETLGGAGGQEEGQLAVLTRVKSGAERSPKRQEHRPPDPPPRRDPLRPSHG